jgi:type II secretory pathway component PulF
MADFEYKVRDKFGKLVTGVIEAEDTENAGSKLKQMGYVPIAVKAKATGELLPQFMRRFQRIKFADINMFTRQLVTLQKAGLPLLTSLSATRSQTSSTILKDTLEEITKDVESGLHLSDALARHPKVFNELYVSMVKAGEAGGMLDEILERLAVLGEHEEQTRIKIQAATRYPIMVVSALAIGFLVLVTFVIPRFARVFGQFNIPLPLPTRLLIGIHYTVSHYWWLMLIGIGLGIYGFAHFIKQEKGRLWWDGIKLKIPVFGPLFTKITMSRFARITGTLTRSGVPILQILDLTARGVGNIVIARTVETIKTNIQEGKGIAEPMRISGMFPPVVIQMVAAGEASGKVDELLLHVSGYYDSQVDYTIKNLTTLIEPILIFILGCVVLFMALGIFMPMWNLMQLFRA